MWSPGLRNHCMISHSAIPSPISASMNGTTPLVGGGPAGVAARSTEACTSVPNARPIEEVVDGDIDSDGEASARERRSAGVATHQDMVLSGRSVSGPERLSAVVRRATLI